MSPRVFWADSCDDAYSTNPRMRTALVSFVSRLVVRHRAFNPAAEEYYISRVSVHSPLRLTNAIPYLQLHHPPQSCYRPSIQRRRMVVYISRELLQESGESYFFTSVHLLTITRGTSMDSRDINTRGRYRSSRTTMEHALENRS